MISVTGATGKTGRAVVRDLVAREAPVRAIVHRHDRLGEMQAHGAVEVRVGDLTSAESLGEALIGSSSVYHICPNMRQDELEIGERLVEACRRVGIERLVYHSVLHPQIEAMPHHWTKLRVEECLIESGLSYTILQPAAYVQNLGAQWENVIERGILEAPYATSTRLGMVDLRDVGEAAARVLTEDGHDGAIYELAGPEVMDQLEIANTFAVQLGRSVDVEVLARSEWAKRADSLGLAPYAVDSLIAMFEHYERCGFWGNPRILEGLLGRPAGRLEQVVRRWAEREETGSC